MNEELARAIADEINDPAYAGRTHGRRGCVNAGCKGPLCRKFNRDRQRILYQQSNPIAKRRRGVTSDPELDLFLDELIEAHANQRSLARAS